MIPLIASLDGKDPPPELNSSLLPCVINCRHRSKNLFHALIVARFFQDVVPVLRKHLLILRQAPLLPKIAILEAARVRELFQPCDLAETRRLILLKGEIIARINEFITKDFNKTYQEAIQSVLHIALLEYYWGDAASVKAHINGLKEMVRLRGGIQSLESELFTKLITLCETQLPFAAHGLIV